MDTNTGGKFKPKPPPKPLFDKSHNKSEKVKQLQQDKKLIYLSNKKIQPSGNLLKDQKPPLLPKPLCLNKPKLSFETSKNVLASSSSATPSLTISPVSSKVIHCLNHNISGDIETSRECKTETFGKIEFSFVEIDGEYSSKSFTSDFLEKSFTEKANNLSCVLSCVDIEENTDVENRSLSVNFDELDRSSFCNKFLGEASCNPEPSISVIDNVNVSEISHVVSTAENDFSDDQIGILGNQSSIIVDDFSSSGSSDNCDKDTGSVDTERTNLEVNLECNESDLKTISFIHPAPSPEVDSQSSDSSCGSFTLISSDYLPGDEGIASDQASTNSSDLCNQSFLHSLNCSNKSSNYNSEKSISNKIKKQSSENQFSVENVMASIIETSTPVAAGNCNVHLLRRNSNNISFIKTVESGENISSNSWTEDEISRDKSNFIDNDAGDGSVSVRRRLSTWFGSFGKGSKQKDKRESCLFYCDEMEATDCSSNTANVSQNQDEVPANQSIEKPVCSINFNPDNNRSSVSEESGEMEQQLVSNSDELPIGRKERKAFFVARELMTSEKVFIDVLKLLCFDFKDFIKNVNKDVKSPVIPEDEFDKIIASLPQLLRLSEDLLQDLESRINSWSQLSKISDVIVKKGPFLKLFSVYIQNFESQCNFLDECCHKYPRFAKALKSFEMSERCKKLSVKHYMLKPVQRIPQYRLLLDDYLAHLDEESNDYDDTQVALNIVSDVANHANKSIKNGDHLCKLLQLQSQLGNYEIIRPWRRFIKEGELCKLSRKENQLRFFILLNDCLLYTTFYGSMTGLRVKYELPLSGMKVTVPQVEDCNTEFSIITSTRSFTLRARSKEECEEWVTALQNAIKENNNRQLTFINMKFVAKNAAAETIKLGKEAPIWIQDKRVTMCQACTAVFTVTFRRHHCRACGKVVCGSCSENKAPLQYMKFQTARVCDSCHNYLLEEFMDPASNMYEIIKSELCLTDYDAITNAIEHIRSSFKKHTNSIKKIRKYIPSRLKEVTANDTGSQMSGWLFRKGKRSWKRLWFVLKEQVLYVYKASEDVVAVESIPILGYKVECVKEGTYEDTDLQYIFQLSHANQDPLVFGTESQNSANKWISAFEEAIVLK